MFESGTFDVILLAGMLPRLPSAEVIREIRRKGGATAPPILLMVSGYHGTNPKADAQRVGAFDIVVKPYTDETFRDALAAALQATDLGARTMQISTAEILGKPSSLTSDDIFSEVLQDVGEKGSAGAHRSADPTATETEVERRLKDTLAGIRAAKAAAVPGGGAPSTPGGGGAAGGGAGARFSTDADIDRMISDTLSGIKTVPRARAAVADRTPPAGTLIPGLTPPPGPRLTAPTIAMPPPPPPPAAHAPTGPVSTPLPPPAAPPPRPAPGPVASSGPDRFGHYEVLERIAAGGMAELSKARLSGAEGFQKILAIKKILPHLADNEEFIAMFADEAKLAAQLNHPNIVHIFDLGKIESGGYFIAMEYVDGRDLRTILQSAKELGTPLPPPLAVYIASKIAAALDYAHRRKDAEGHDLNIVHRDVSPPNILISYEGDIKLCDFGIAKAASKASQTQSGALKGKVQYMSPEQAWGRPIDKRSDIFSLGCVLYEMLTEQKLFRGDTDLSVLEKVRAAQVSPPSAINPEVPKSLDAVLMKALARDLDDRYSNASEMLRDLEAVLYSYSPAPGSADLAIYLHRLQAEEAAIAESRAREAARSATPASPEKKRKSKNTPVARRTTGSVTAPGAAAPGSSPGTGPGTVRREPTAPGVYGAPPAARAAAEKKSRTPLYAMIGAAVVVLAGGVYWIVTRPSTTAAPAPVRATPLPVAPAPTSAPAVAPPAPAAASVDPKVIKEEVQRQLAARRKELQKALEPPKPAKETAPAASAKKTDEPATPVTPAKETAREPAPVREKEPEPASTIPVKEAAPEPTAVPQRAAPVVPAPAREEVSRGDLVGPGSGVVEPALVSTPRVNYPAIARQQRVTGRVIVLVLVNEEGAVAEARLQQGVPPRYGVNEAVVEAVRTSKFRPATKNGTAVKMWRTVVVEVKP
jgi:TonB family protein